MAWEQCWHCFSLTQEATGDRGAAPSRGGVERADDMTMSETMASTGTLLRGELRSEHERVAGASMKDGTMVYATKGELTSIPRNLFGGPQAWV
jgi:hypothetical protein